MATVDKVACFQMAKAGWQESPLRELEEVCAEDKRLGLR